MADKNHFNPDLEALDDGVVASEFQTAGIIRDAQGNEWTIPEGSLDEDFTLYSSPFDIPNKDSRFYYQFEEDSNVPQMMSEQFVPVTRKELGMKEFTPVGAAGEYGTGIDGFYRVRKAHLY